MPAAFSMRVLESIIRIEFAETLSAADSVTLRSPWRGLEVDTARTPDAVIRVIVDDRRRVADPAKLVATRTVPEAAQALATAVTLAGMDGVRGRALLLHAAGIALDDGRVIGLVGPSGRGKTTVARALSQKYGYVTDETLAIRPDLSVIPYPKPLSVVVGAPPKHSIAPESLGMRPLPSAPLALSSLALLERRPDVADAFIEEVGLAEAIGLIAPETSALIALHHPLGDLVDILQRSGGVHRVVYSDADQLMAVVPDLLAAAPRHEEVQTVSREESDSARSLDADPGDPDTPTYRRAGWVDAVRVGDRLVLHNGARVFVLDGIAPELWQGSNDATLAELVERVARELPPPPGTDTGGQVERYLQELTDAGLLWLG